MSMEATHWSCDANAQRWQRFLLQWYVAGVVVSVFPISLSWTRMAVSYPYRDGGLLFLEDLRRLWEYVTGSRASWKFPEFSSLSGEVMFGIVEGAKGIGASLEGGIVWVWGGFVGEDISPTVSTMSRRITGSSNMAGSTAVIGFSTVLCSEPQTDSSKEMSLYITNFASSGN